MGFLKRIGGMIYLVIMVAAGTLCLAVALKLITSAHLTNTINIVTGSITSQIVVGGIGLIFIVIGIVTPYRLSKSIKRDRMIAFQNPDGEVTVSLLAVEEYVRKLASEIPGVKDVKARVISGKKGINVITSMSLSGGPNIPELSEMMQVMLRTNVQNMLGVEEKILVKLHINKLGKGAVPEAGPAQEEPEEPMHVPFRG